MRCGGAGGSRGGRGPWVRGPAARRHASTTTPPNLARQLMAFLAKRAPLLPLPRSRQAGTLTTRPRGPARRGQRIRLFEPRSWRNERQTSLATVETRKSETLTTRPRGRPGEGDETNYMNPADLQPVVDARLAAGRSVARGSSRERRGRAEPPRSRGER